MEWEIRLRLFYIQAISNLRNLSGGMEQGLVAYMEHRLEQVREGISMVWRERDRLRNRIRIVKQDQKCLQALIEAEAQDALHSISQLQQVLRKTEVELGDLSQEAGMEIPDSSFSRVFPVARSPPSMSMMPDLSQPPPSLTGVNFSGFPHYTDLVFPAPDMGSPVMIRQ